MDCFECPLRRKAVFRQMSPAEIGFVDSLKSSEVELPAHEHIVRAGGNGHRLYTLLSGWAFSYKMLPRGRRQILDFMLPGDIIGLQSPTTGRVDHSVCAITPVTLCVLDGEPFTEVFERHPAFAAALVAMILRDQTLTDVHRLLLGREHPTKRLAHLLLELRERLIQRELADGADCPFPLTYELMADASGMSRSQLAHSLGELREFGWVVTRPGWLHFGDVAAMGVGCGYSEPAGHAPRAML